MALTVIHLTDLHLVAEPGARLHGWDVARAFTRVFDAAVGAYPDFDALVLGGDLVDDESAAGYRWLNDHLSKRDRPVLAIAGNHDDPALMARELSRAHVHDSITLGDWRLVGLNSHRRNSEGGCIGDNRLATLDAELAAGEAPAALFVHHPAWPVGSAWIDAIGLADGAELGRVVTAHPRVRAVVCGHAHQAQRVAFGNAVGWVTPATMRQFLPGAQRFAEDQVRTPGYRCLRLAASGHATSVVERVAVAR